MKYLLIILIALLIAGCGVKNYEQCVEAGGYVSKMDPSICEYEGVMYDQMLGGQRDDHGCLGPAGYSYNETIGACLREWELNSEQRIAAKQALQDNKLSVTIIQVNVMDNKYLIYLQNNDNQKTFTIEHPKSDLPKLHFCGVSTEDQCTSNDDCRSGGCSGHVCQSANTPPRLTTCEFRECYVAKDFNKQCLCLDNKCMWG